MRAPRTSASFSDITRPSAGMHDRRPCFIQQAVEVVPGDAGDRQLALAVAEFQPRGHAAHRLGADHAGQVFQIVETFAPTPVR
jgi:hypothetical protein